MIVNQSAVTMFKGFKERLREKVRSEREHSLTHERETAFQAFNKKLEEYSVYIDKSAVRDESNEKSVSMGDSVISSQEFTSREGQQ